jgi:DNA-binding LacI/PurR family transcriptional regulator
MKYTMEDIARICGVSRGTVNRAIYNKPGINEETRKRILDLIAEVGYFPDRSVLSTAITCILLPPIPIQIWRRRISSH